MTTEKGIALRGVLGMEDILSRKRPWHHDDRRR